MKGGLKMMNHEFGSEKMGTWYRKIAKGSKKEWKVKIMGKSSWAGKLEKLVR